MATKRARASSSYRCVECGWETAKWVGRCGECQVWGSVAERGVHQVRVQPSTPENPAIPISEVPAQAAAFTTSGVPELDRVLGGGLVAGAVLLLAGEPGVGKSTLLLEVAAQTARYQRRTLYVTGEESAAQVRLRADRTGAVQDQLLLAAETDLGAVLSHIDTVQPELLVIDSVQTIAAADIDGVPGGVSQVKEVAAALVRVAKSRGITTILVGHVTKDGTIAGPRVLEHLVDVVLQFEGERTSRFRVVRATKNRFGPVDEVGCFDLTASGITAITDPSGIYLGSHDAAAAGTCVVGSMEGRRPMLTEVQGLVTWSPNERPRRTSSGLDPARVALVIAVLAEHASVRLHNHDVFTATVGGARLTEPAADLAVALALVSASSGIVLPRGLIAVGELGLAGEVRRVPDVALRLAEAARLGFTQALVPKTGASDQPSTVAGLRVHRVGSIQDAILRLGLTTAQASPRTPD